MWKDVGFIKTTYPVRSVRKVERFHRTLGNKLARDKARKRDLYLTQALAAVRFTTN